MTHAVEAPALAFRSYEPSDSDAVRDLFLATTRSTWKATAAPTRTCATVWRRIWADIEGTYLNAGGHFWVATAVDPETKRAIVVGTIALERKSEAQGELRRLSVKASHRRFGLGRLLIAHLEQWARAQEFKSVGLTTAVAMKDAIAFYPKVGYTEIKREFAAETKNYEVAHFLKQL